MTFDQRLYSFLFDPTDGVPIGQVKSLFSNVELEAINTYQAGDVQIRNLANQKINLTSLLQDIQLTNFEQSIIHKLPLLTQKEWQLLGLGIALLPYSGRISRSMDGHFRRNIRTVLKDVEIEALDDLAESSEQNNFFSTRPRFLAPSTVWKNIDIVQAGGTAAIIQELCDWPQIIASRVSWKLKFLDQQVSPIVTGLQPQHIDVLCKILLPNHPWLLSTSQTH